MFARLSHPNSKQKKEKDKFLHILSETSIYYVLVGLDKEITGF